MKVWISGLCLGVAVHLTGLAVADEFSQEEKTRASQNALRQITETYGEPVAPDPVAPVPVIFGRIAACATRHDVDYRVSVVEDEEINAYALPDGQVVFLGGLLRALPAGDQDAVAFVAGHEVAHIENHHAERFYWGGGLTGLAVALLTQNQKYWVQALAGVASGIVISGYSRGMEAEADRDGLALMQKAGYRPQGALVTLRLFKDMARKHGGLRIFPTHPNPDARYEDAMAYLREQGLAIPPGAILSDTGVVDLGLAATLEQAKAVQTEVDQAPRAGQGDPEVPRRAVRTLVADLENFRATLDWGNGSEAGAFRRLLAARDEFHRTRDLFYFTSRQRQAIARLDEQMLSLETSYLSRRATNVRELADFLWQETAAAPESRDASDRSARDAMQGLARASRQLQESLGTPESSAALNEWSAQARLWAQCRSSLPLGSAHAELVQRLEREIGVVEVACGVSPAPAAALAPAAPAADPPLSAPTPRGPGEPYYLPGPAPAPPGAPALTPPLELPLDPNWGAPPAPPGALPTFPEEPQD